MGAQRLVLRCGGGDVEEERRALTAALTGRVQECGCEVVVREVVTGARSAASVSSFTMLSGEDT